MFELKNIPLDVLNRALEMYGISPKTDKHHALFVLTNASQNIDLSETTASNGIHLTPLALAVAEYMSLSGPWSEDNGDLLSTGFKIS